VCVCVCSRKICSSIHGLQYAFLVSLTQVLTHMSAVHSQDNIARQGIYSRCALVRHSSCICVRLGSKSACLPASHKALAFATCCIGYQTCLHTASHC
jgi:hypothetical protein